MALVMVAAITVIDAALLRLLFLPSQRELQVTLIGDLDTLEVLPDVGRGFFDRDLISVRIEPGVSSVSTGISFTARALELRSPGAPVSGTVGLIRVDGHDFHTGTPFRREHAETVTLTRLPDFSSVVPAWGHLLCLLSAVTMTVAGRAVVVRLGAGTREPVALLSGLGALTVIAGFGWILAAVGNAADVYAALVTPIDNPPYWPISIFEPATPRPRSILIAALIGVCFVPVAHFVLKGARGALPTLLLLAVSTFLATNTMRGMEAGFSQPLTDVHAFTHDAAAVDDAWQFLATFNDVQWQLGTHARTHPPGAVLFYYVLLKILDGPMGIAVLVGIVIGIALPGLLFAVGLHFTDRRHALFAALALAAAPATQIYAVHSLDAVIATVFLATVLAALQPNAIWRCGGLLLGLSVAMFLTFGALFLGPVVIMCHRAARLPLWPAGLAATSVGAFYVGIAHLFGFDWLTSLRVASTLENPQGFRLFHAPADFVFTRLEGIAEIATFGGPFLILCCVLGLRLRHPSPALRSLNTVALAGILTLTAMLIAGAFKTGETARACLFVYPYLVLPLAALAARGSLDTRRQLTLVSLLMSQSLFMQLIGDYVW